MTAEGEVYESPVGTRGEFYLEDLPAGRYAATVLFEGRTCEFTVTTGAGTGERLQLGVLECVASGGQASGQFQ